MSTATFLDLYSSHVRVLERAGIEPSDLTDEKDQNITDLLNISKGYVLENGVKIFHFRPFLVAAIMIQQSLDDQAISEAKNVVFTGYKSVIESLLNTQRGYDLALDLVVPRGFSASEWLDKLCGCSDGGYPVNLMSVQVI